MAKLATLVDAFTESVLDTALWNASTAGQVALDPVRDLVVLNVPTSSSTNSLGAGVLLDATGSALYAQLWPVQNASATMSMTMRLDAGSGNAASMSVRGDGSFQLRIETADVVSVVPLPAYDPMSHRWWRLSESTGTFTAEGSPDGQTWTTLGSAAYSWDATAVRVFFQAGTTGTEAAGLAVGIAHVNTRAGGDSHPKLRSLQDPFTGPLDTRVWNASSTSQCTIDPVNDQLLLNVGTTSGTDYSLGAGGPYDATGSSLYAQVTPAPGGASSLTLLRLDAGAGHSVEVTAAVDGSFRTRVQRNGTYVAGPALPSYDPHAHRWWRMTETNSAFVFATSLDGHTWTDQATIPYAWPFTACSVYFQTSTTADQLSGQAAAFAHINTLRGGRLNLDWPLVKDEWGPRWNANRGHVPLDYYVDVTPRTQGTVSTTRGRQYELDQVQTGEAQMTLRNTDGALDPDNAAGPWANHVRPYQPYRRRAQWPPSINLLTQTQATGGDLGGQALGTIDSGNDGPDVFSATDASGGQFVASTSAWRGGTVMQFSVPTTAAGGAGICYTMMLGVEPGATYTQTVRVRNVTPSTAVDVRAGLWFRHADRTWLTEAKGLVTTLTGSDSAGWTTLTVTGTAPAAAAGMYVGVAVATAPVTACTVQVDGWQLEAGDVASPWACPGEWHPVFSGFVERWPQRWSMSGTYRQVQPTAVDALALLSQVELDDPLTEEINAASPRFLFKLDDPSDSTTAADATGNYPAAPIAASKYGAGSLTFGSSITAADTVGGVFTGSPGPVVTINNASPGTATTAAATFLNLSAAGITGPADPGLFTRMLAFRYTGPAPTTAAACVWSAMDSQRTGNAPSGSRIYLYLFDVGTGPARPVLYIGAADGSVMVNLSLGDVNCADGNWHFVTFGLDYSTGRLVVSLDGAVIIAAGNWTSKPTGIISDTLGGFVDATVGNGTTWNWQGDIAFAGEFPTLLSSTQINNLYHAWKDACVGESTDARYARILRYGGYNGASVLEAGSTSSMGPAAIAGQDVVSALQGVVDTENGEHFVDRAGRIRFRGRSARYNTVEPAVTFGERADLGEWPYEDVETDFDPTHLSNEVAVTQQSTGQVFYANDADSATDYYPRTLSRTLNTTLAEECQDAANYLLSRYRQPVTRVSTLKLHPSAIPGLWAVCLSLELGTRVRVMRRSPGAPVTQLEAFVERMQWDFGDNGDAWLTLQCSPADTTPYAVFSPWYATLAAPVAAGATTMEILNQRDNFLPLAAQLAPGQRLVLGLGTATQETVTVSSVSGTEPGWTAATITLTTSTSASHNTNDLVSEPLTPGVTDPTTWDAASRFDDGAFAY